MLGESAPPDVSAGDILAKSDDDVSHSSMSSGAQSSGWVADVGLSCSVAGDSPDVTAVGRRSAGPGGGLVAGGICRSAGVFEVGRTATRERQKSQSRRAFMMRVSCKDTGGEGWESRDQGSSVAGMVLEVE